VTNVSFAIFSMKTLQINQMYLPFCLLNASVTSFNYSEVMSKRTVKLFSPAAVKIDDAYPR
jgi:hypothetical protein